MAGNHGFRLANKNIMLACQNVARMISGVSMNKLNVEIFVILRISANINTLSGGDMNLQRHLERTLGEGREVHIFLDQYRERFGNDHRVILHHWRGIDFVVRNLAKTEADFGMEGNIARICKQHIKDDFYDFGDDIIPFDFKDREYFRPEWAYDLELYNAAVEFAKNLFK